MTSTKRWPIQDTLGFPDRYEPYSAFLRFVAKTGNLQVFVLNDDKRTNFFYKLENEPFQELKFKLFYNQGTVSEVFEYRQQLYNLLNKEIEKQKLQIDLTKVAYTEDGFIRLFSQLTPVEKRRKTIKNAAEGVVIGTGVSLNFFNVKGDPSLDQVSTKYSPSLAPLLFVGYISPLNCGFGKFFVYPQLKAYKFENKGTLLDGNATSRTIYKASVALSPIVNVGINLVNDAQRKVFMMAGAGMLLLFKNKEVDQTFQTSTGRITQTRSTKVSNLTYALNGTVGIFEKNKIIASVTYSLPFPMGNFVYYTPYHSNAQLAIGYKL